MSLHGVDSGIFVSSLNSSTASLGAGASFNGTAEDVRGFPEITINLAGAPSVAPGTLFFEFSPDGINWDVSVPYTLAGPNSFVPLSLRTVLPFFRVKYVNGATPLTQFRLTTVYHYNSAKNLTRVLNQSIDENEPVENVRAFIGGKTPDGPYQNIPSGGMVTAQSSNTPLLANATFNASGTPVAVAGYVAVNVLVKSDVNSATDGVAFQFFADSGATRLLREALFTYGSSPNGINIQVPIQGPYLRVKYTNGGSNQTTFEFNVNLNITAPPSDVLAISEVINDNTVAQIVKSNIVGKQENGIYNNVGLSNSSSVKVAITDRPSEVRSRTLVEQRIFRSSLTGTPTTIYTVTGGKTLYITAFIASFINNANAIGEWRLRDGTTEKFGFVSGEKAVGASAPSQAPSPPLPEPIPFTSSVNAIEISGDIQLSFWFIGYEE